MSDFMAMFVMAQVIATVIVCVLIAKHLFFKKDEPDIPYGSIVCSQSTYDEIGPERLRAELKRPNARVIVIPDNKGRK